MGNETVQALLHKAAALYRNGEILSALAEWEHALAIDPNCHLATRALSALRDNYDLLDETLRPGGKPLDVSQYVYSQSERPPGTGKKAVTGVVLAPVESADTQPSEFFSEATAELPGIQALEAVASAQVTAGALAADDDFHNQPTGDMPGIDGLSAMHSKGTQGRDAGDASQRGEGFHSMPTAELPGIAALSTLPGLASAEDWTRKQHFTARTPRADARIVSRNAPGDTAPNMAPNIAPNDTAPNLAPNIPLDDLATDFGNAATLDVKSDHFDDIELGRAGAPAPASAPSTNATQELGTRATEELAMFARSHDFSLGLAGRPRTEPQPAGGHASDLSAEDDTAPQFARDAFADAFADEDEPLGGQTLADTGDTLGLDEDWTKNALTPAGMESREVAFPSLHAIERGIREDVERGAKAGESASDRTRRRVKGLIERAQRAHAQGDTVRAIIALELAFVEDPDSAVSHKLLNLHRETVATIFELYLGDFQAALTLNVALTELKYEHIDARAAFLLSRVDGSLSIEELLDVAGMRRVEALRYLSSMVLRGILILSG